jgi:hypothetical protein
VFFSSVFIRTSHKNVFVNGEILLEACFNERISAALNVSAFKKWFLLFISNMLQVNGAGMEVTGSWTYQGTDGIARNASRHLALLFYFPPFFKLWNLHPSAIFLILDLFFYYLIRSLCNYFILLLGMYCRNF